MDPNFFAQMLAPGVAVSAVRLIGGRRSGRPDRLALAATLTGTAALLLTYSRGGLVAMLLALLLFMFRWLGWRALIPVVAAAVLLVPLAPDAVVGRVSTAAVTGPKALDGEVVEDSAINGRASEAIVGFQQFSDHWLLGVGIGNYETHYLEYAGNVGLDDRGEERSAHSLLIETIAEQGLLGLGTLLVTVLLAFAAVRSLRHRSVASDERLWWCALAVEAGLVAQLITSVFLHNSYPRPLWLVLGLAFACGQMQPAEPSPEEQPGESRALPSAGHR
jgi:O-antigen ligase